MKYEWIDEYLLEKAGVTKDLKIEWNWIRYQIGGKMFVATCLDDSNNPYYITLKSDPLESEFLRNVLKKCITLRNKMINSNYKIDLKNANIIISFAEKTIEEINQSSKH